MSAMNARQAAAVLGVSARQAYDLAAPNGPIPCTRIGRRVVFDQADIEEFKAKCRFTETRRAVASALSSTRVSAANESALQSSFRALGIVPKRTPSTANTRAASTPQREASVIPITQSKTQ
jgi:excisionase family DNA binding protein